MTTRREFMQRGGAIAAGLLAAPALGSLAACSSKDDTGPMSFWNFYGPGGGVPNQDKWFRTTVAQWNGRQQRDRDQIALRYVPNAEYISGSVLSTGFAADNGPDVFLLSPGDFLRYYNGGALQDLTPHLAPGLRDDYVSGALETRTVDGKVYGLPMELEPLAVYYDKRAFDRAKVSTPPTSWDELLDLGERLRTGGRFGLCFETTPGYYQNFTWYPFMWMGDGSPVNARSDGSSFDSAAVRAALDFWGRSISRGISPRSMLGTGGGDISANLGSGYTAMQQTGVWAIADHAAGPAKDVPIGVFKLPTPPGGKYTTALGGWAFVANARGKNPERAAEFCAWALGSTDAAGIERCRQWNTVVKTNLPPRKSVRAAAEQRGAFTGLFKTFADEIVVGARGEPRYPPQVYKAVSDAIQAVQLGGESASGAASRAADIIDSYLGVTVAQTSPELEIAPTVAPPDIPTPARPRHRRSGQARTALLMVAPDVIGLFVFLIVPMVLAIVFSFMDIDGFGNYAWEGLSNYRQLVDDPQFWSALKVSALYAVVFVPAVFVVGLALALLIRDAFPGLAIIRTVLFTPYVISLVVVGILWKFLLSEKRGFATGVLDKLGLGQQSWLGDPDLALWSLVAVSVWVYSGYYMVLFLAGLKDIPDEYYDAARVDGAGAFQQFRSVTWPLLRPTSFFVLMTSLIAAVAGPQAFDLVFVTTKGGPNNSTQTVVTYIYMQAFQFGDFGYASAIASVLLVALLAVTAVLFGVTRGGRFE